MSSSASERIKDIRAEDRPDIEKLWDAIEDLASRNDAAPADYAKRQNMLGAV